MPTNVLSADNATFDTGVGDWTGTSISRVTSPTPHAGSGVLAIANTDLAAELPLGVTPQIPNGHIVTVSAWMRQSSPGTMAANLFAKSTSHANYFGVGDVLPTTSWQFFGNAFIIRGAGSDTVSVFTSRNSAYVSPTVLYLSDVFVGHEPVNPPFGLAAVDNAGDADLSWTDGADQYVGYIDLPGSPPNLVRDWCKVSVERSDGGGAYTEVHTQAATSTTWTDTTVVPGVVYAYRIRYAIYSNDLFLDGVRGYSAYSNVATLGAALGGWGVGMVRMGGN